MKTKVIVLLLALSVFNQAAEVVLKTSTGELHGTFEAIEGELKYVVIIIPGSGPTDRDGNNPILPGKNNSLKYLAEFLRGEKISSLRIDKRGVAASAKAMVAEKDLRLNTYVDDVVRWINFLRKKGAQKITIIGHSEGSLIGMLAVQKVRVDGYISIAGVARPAADLLLEQLSKQLPAAMMQEVKSTIETLKAGKTTDRFPPALANLFRPSVQPYLISWFKYDPAKEIAKLKVPILIMHGDTDIQIPTQAAKSLHAGASGSKLEIINGMNHVLKVATQEKKSQDAAYTDSKIPLHPRLGKVIVGFVR